MSELELQQAYANRCPIQAFTRAISVGGDWVEYAYIDAIVKTRDKHGNDVLCAELMDKNGRSIIRVRAENIKKKGDKENEQ